MGLQFSTSLHSVLRDHQHESKVAATLLSEYRTTTEFGDYLAMRSGLITYLPKGRKHEVNDDNSWKRDNRQEGRPAKIVRRFIVSSYVDTWLTDKDFEIFANLIKSKDVTSIGTFRLVSGEDIRGWYHERVIAKGTGSLETSCMRYKNCQPFFDIYVDNPNMISMLILENDGRLYGRAIVWTLENGQKYMDRIYGNDMVIEGFRDYAREQGWWFRYYNTYNYERMLVVDGKVKETVITLKPKNIKYRYYPYMDTLKYISPKSGTISNRQTNGAHTIANQHGEAVPPIRWPDMHQAVVRDGRDRANDPTAVLRGYIDAVEEYRNVWIDEPEAQPEPQFIRANDPEGRYWLRDDQATLAFNDLNAPFRARIYEGAERPLNEIRLDVEDDNPF